MALLGACPRIESLLRKSHFGPFLRSFSLNMSNYTQSTRYAHGAGSSPQMIEKMTSKWLSLATTPILGQAPSGFAPRLEKIDALGNCGFSLVVKRHSPADTDFDAKTMEPGQSDILPGYHIQTVIPGTVYLLTVFREANRYTIPGFRSTTSA